jgi:hypothetical protein
MERLAGAVEFATGIQDVVEDESAVSPAAALAPLWPPFRSAAVVSAGAAEEEVAPVPALAPPLLPPLPPLPPLLPLLAAVVAAVVATEAATEALVAVAATAAADSAAMTDAANAEFVAPTMASEAAAAAAIPLDPSFAATLIVVPSPLTTNLVQSSGVPRWATGIRTG